jgi:hypothetical protein
MEQKPPSNTFRVQRWVGKRDVNCTTTHRVVNAKQRENLSCKLLASAPYSAPKENLICLKGSGGRDRSQHADFNASQELAAARKYFQLMVSSSPPSRVA